MTGGDGLEVERAMVLELMAAAPGSATVQKAGERLLRAMEKVAQARAEHAALVAALGRARGECKEE